MNYRRFNCILMLVLLAWPPMLLLVPWMRMHLGPFYPGCVLERIAGLPCPLCGLTTHLRNMITGHPDITAHPLILPVALLWTLELIGRVGLSIRPLAPDTTRTVQRADARIHMVFLLAYGLYSLIFFAAYI